MIPAFYLPVKGTHELNDRNDWATVHQSPVAAYLAKRFALFNLNLKASASFEWSTDLDLRATDRDWPIAGRNLFAFLVPPLRPQAAWPSNETRLLTHSHGLQVALFAAAAGLKIDVLLDVAGPVRADMMATARLARPNIRRWVHVYSDYTDKWQWLGELFDGHLGIVRQHKLADRNVKLPGAGHTGLLNETVFFHYWTDARLGNELRGESCLTTIWDRVPPR